MPGRPSGTVSHAVDIEGYAVAEAQRLRDDLQAYGPPVQERTRKNMKNPLKGGNWGLKLLALVLAVVIYHALKTETSGDVGNDRPLFQYR